MSRVLLLIVLVCAAGCNAPERQEHRVRHPQLEALEEEVRRTLENAHRQWRERLDRAAEPTDRAQAYAQLGQVYLAHKFDEAAADALSYATTHNTQNWRWYFYHARALEQSFRLSEAEVALTKALALHGDDEVLFLRAQVRARQGDVTGALNDINALRDDPQDVAGDSQESKTAPEKPVTQAAWLALEAKLLAGQRRYSESVERLSLALELAPDASALHGPLAQLHQRLGQASQARAHLIAAGNRLPESEQPLMQALTLLSRGSQHYLDRGHAAMKERNFQQAVTDFATAADISPSNHDARLSYARALEIVGQISLAESEYQAALELNPQSSVAHYFLGALYERQQRDELARRHYADALVADPEYLPPRMALAHTLFRNRQFEAALGHYVYYAEAREGDLESRYYAGLAALSLGDCETAPEWFQQAAGVNSNSRAAQVGIARSLAVCSDDPGELSRAQDIAERLEEEQPDASAAATLAMVYSALNDFESAVQWQTLAVRRSAEEQITGQSDRLTQYESGVRAQVAWLAGDPIFNPPRLTMRVRP